VISRTRNRSSSNPAPKSLRHCNFPDVNKDSSIFGDSNFDDSSPSLSHATGQRTPKAFRKFSEDVLSLSSPHSMDSRDMFEQALKAKKCASPMLLKSHIFDRLQGKLGKGGVCVEYSDQGLTGGSYQVFWQFSFVLFRHW